MKAGFLGERQRVPPMPVYLDYHSRIVAALDHGQLDPAAMAEIHQANRAVKATLDEMPGYRIPTPGPGE
jgi:hypothetical protein